jgi:hypothetical protein
MCLFLGLANRKEEADQQGREKMKKRGEGSICESHGRRTLICAIDLEQGTQQKQQQQQRQLQQY